MKRLYTRVGLAIGVSSVLAGCASGPAFQAPEEPQPGSAQLYVYRPTRFVGGVNVHQVKIDARADALRLPNGSWQRVQLTPGTHTVAISDYLGIMHCRPLLQVQLQAGQTAYVENVVELASYTAAGNVGFSNLACSTVVRSADQALKDLSGLRSAGQ